MADDTITIKDKAPHHLQDHNRETAETEDEALSLTEVILNSDEIVFPDRTISSTSDPSEFFEFFHNLNNSENMSHAEDIIFCGKLMPHYKVHHSQQTLQLQQPLHQYYSKTNHLILENPTTNERQRRSFHRKRSESFKDLKTIPSNGAKNELCMRTSRSLDYQKMYGSSARAEKVEMERSSSTKSSGTKEKIPRPRWYMMFGLVKFPQEMVYQDMKSRQLRRNPPGNLFASVDGVGGCSGGGKAIVNRPGNDRRWSRFWDLLGVLSCKDHASVAVTASFGCLQHV
ncbi:hypothetical protein ACH5RR_006335 [Cinchona calisaya]|uniref:Uncharacterized protein n=1 Tax=Cinchona calisaya TaxID=153742 RepID=A0ABD3ANR2_9GENT